MRDQQPKDPSKDKGQDIFLPSSMGNLTKAQVEVMKEEKLGATFAYHVFGGKKPQPDDDMNEISSCATLTVIGKENMRRLKEWYDQEAQYFEHNE